MTTVLVVDDLAADRRLAGSLLEKKSDFEVIYAEDGRQALEQVEAHIPDLVVTDLIMPHLNGLELVEAVKRDYPLIPVVLMTSQGSEEIAVQALQKGAASYVPKQILARDLLERVQQVLSASQEGRGLARIMNRINLCEDSFTLENSLELFPPLVSYLEKRTLDLRVCGKSELVRVGVALHEALLNACYHGNFEIGSYVADADIEAFHELAEKRSTEAPYCDRRIHVNARFSPSQAVFAIRDEGPGFDLGRIPDPTDPSNIDRPCGRGILLMRIFMDEVNYNDTANEVTLVKHRAAFAEDPEETEAN